MSAAALAAVLAGAAVAAQDDDSTAELLAMFQAFGASQEEASQALSTLQAMGIDPSDMFGGMDPEMVAALAGADGQLDQSALMELVMSAATRGALPAMDDLVGSDADTIATDAGDTFEEIKVTYDEPPDLYAALAPVYEQLGLDVATDSQGRLPGLCQDWDCVIPIYEQLGMDPSELFAKAAPPDDHIDELYAVLAPVYEQLGMDPGALFTDMRPLSQTDEDVFTTMDGPDVSLDDASAGLVLAPGEEAVVSICFPDVCMDESLMDPTKVSAIQQLLGETDPLKLEAILQILDS